MIEFVDKFIEYSHFFAKINTYKFLFFNKLIFYKTKLKNYSCIFI